MSNQEGKTIGKTEKMGKFDHVRQYQRIASRSLPMWAHHWLDFQKVRIAYSGFVLRYWMEI